MVMQAGFCLFETGLVRSKNNINVAFKNLSDFAVTAVMYWLVGYGLMYGASIAGLFGTTDFFFEPTNGNGAFFLFQLMFCGATATIVGGALAERTSFSAYLLISLLIGSVLYPIPGHWIWAAGQAGWLGSLGFIDFAGGTAVHLLGGCLALVAVIIVGPRIGRFSIDENNKTTAHKINASNYPIATVGVILLWFGWFGFNTGSLMGDYNGLPLVAINTALSAAAGAATLILWFLFKSGKPDIASVLNGTLAGLVGVTAGAHAYSVFDAIIVGAVCAALVQVATVLLEKLRIDDVVSAFPVHAVAGFAGTLLVAILGEQALFPNNNGHLQQFGIQLTGASVVVLWSLTVGFGAFWFLNKLHPMRVSEAEELQGLNFSEHGATTEVHDLLGAMIKQSNTGNFNEKVAVEPHTEVGQIAEEYNKVLERIRLEIETREQAYAQLKEASHFQYIFDNSNEGIIQFSTDGNVQKANKSAADLLGYASVDRLIHSIGPFMGNLDFKLLTAHTDLMKELKQRGQLLDTEICFTRETDKKLGYASLTLRSISGNEEKEPCFLASFVDVGKKRENEQLKVDNRAAQAANKAKSQFLANMSHEIRTPLNGVTGMLELLARTDLEPHQKRYIDIGKNSAQSLLSVINDILDFSKIEAGKMELDSVDFPLQETLSDVVDIFAAQAASKQLELIGHIPPDLPEWVKGDPERLRQVLINLLGNAVKFTESGSISLIAKCKKRTENIVVLEFQIQDTGCGISEGSVSELFTSFTQADSSTTRRYGGTGLGLTISKQLINLMKGRINVKSKLGEGSVFTIDLAMPLAKGRSGRSSSLPDSFSGMRVLVVDDHPVNLELTQELLVPFGLKIDCAESAADAMAMHNTAAQQNRPYELFLLDYHMPEVDGVDLAKLVRSTDTGKNAKLILLTSIDQVHSNDEGMDLFDTLLVKPVRASRLFDSIADVMSDRLLADKHGCDDVPTQRTGNSDIVTGKRILVVEDNMVNQLVATEILEQAGYTTETADNGQEALDRLQTENYDLILMDCQMPVLDGFETTAKIRALDNSTAELPIVALTANALKGDRQRCLDAGMDDYITKPLDAEVLYTLLKKYLASGYTRAA
jgi:Amt family ammonium transporter